MQPTDRTTPVAEEVVMIRLPCGHLTATPTRLDTTIACPCGQTWRLTRANGELSARLTTPATS